MQKKGKETLLLILLLLFSPKLPNGTKILNKEQSFLVSNGPTFLLKYKQIVHNLIQLENGQLKFYCLTELKF